MPETEGSTGGRFLALEKKKFSYGEHDLGNVDPASSTMNLLLLGFRGIATSVLVDRSHRTAAWQDYGGERASHATEVDYSVATAAS